MENVVNYPRRGSMLSAGPSCGSPKLPSHFAGEDRAITALIPVACHCLPIFYHLSLSNYSIFVYYSIFLYHFISLTLPPLSITLNLSLSLHFCLLLLSSTLLSHSISVAISLFYCISSINASFHVLLLCKVFFKRVKVYLLL